MSWILSGISVLMIWLMGNKNKYAPLVGLVGQIAWIYYAIFDVKDYGLISGAVVFIFVHGRNLIKWMREDKNKNPIEYSEMKNGDNGVWLEPKGSHDTDPFAEQDSKPKSSKVCGVCWTSSFEPTEDGERCLCCWQHKHILDLTTENKKLAKKVADLEWDVLNPKE